MAKISTKDKFINELIKFTKTNRDTNLITNFSDNIIVIDETEPDGEGEIFLDISNYSLEEYLFVKIIHKSNHTIGSNSKHNDGIVLKVNLLDKKIEVFLFELTTLTHFNLKLFKSLYENRDKLPLQIPFCPYREYDFHQLVFGTTISI